MQNSRYSLIILGCCFYREVKGSREKVISDEDLELLLDRSDLIGEYLPFLN